MKTRTAQRFVFHGALLFLLGLLTGASRLMPIAGAGHTGPARAEALVGFGLLSISFAMVAGVAVVLWGVVRNGRS